MSLRDVLAGWRMPLRPLPDPGVVASLDASPTSGAGVLPPPVADLDSVANRFIVCVQQGDNPTAADWNKIAWCLWTTRPAIAENDKALDAVLGRVARMGRRRPYRQLASAYLAEFAPDRPRLGRVASVLAGRAAEAGDPWSDLQAKFGLFDGVEASDKVAGFALAKKTSVPRFLESLHMSGPLLEAGFAKAAHDKGLENLRATAVTRAADRVDAIRRWCLRDDRTLIFTDCKASLARAVIGPLPDRIPVVERDSILGFLVGQFGDPRVNPGGWIGMDDTAELVKHWLTGVSLRQFFDVVDKIAPDRAWKYRRAFWQAYHEKDLIRNAWVVFGSDGAAQANRSFGRSVGFGVFKGGGGKQIQPGHAVLLLDLRQCVVADWSYSGFCNIWPSADPSRPRNINAASYTSDEVRRAVPSDRSELNLTRHDIFGHGGSENYIWQDRVARRLHELIGVRIPQSAYHVR